MEFTEGTKTLLTETTRLEGDGDRSLQEKKRRVPFKGTLHLFATQRDMQGKRWTQQRVFQNVGNLFLWHTRVVGIQGVDLFLSYASNSSCNFREPEAQKGSLPNMFMSNY